MEIQNGREMKPYSLLIYILIARAQFRPVQMSGFKHYLNYFVLSPTMTEPESMKGAPRPSSSRFGRGYLISGPR